MSETRQHPWPVGAATGVGSLPGTDIAEALRTVLGELPDLPYLPELPARGPGAEIIGRTAGLLVGLPVDLYVGHWRMVARPGIDARRIADLLARDLDALTDVATDFTGVFKVQAAGPWTLAAGLDRQLGGPVLGDHGAARDLAASLAEGLAAHVAEVGRRLPGARVLLQLDEPSLPAVLAGRVRTESGLYTLRSVGVETARSALREVIDAAGVPVVVHCCAPDAPVTLLREAGAAAVALDLTQLGNLDPIGEALDAGIGLFAGAVPTSGATFSASSSLSSGRSSAELSSAERSAAERDAEQAGSGADRSGSGNPADRVPADKARGGADPRPVEQARLPAEPAARAGGGHPGLRPGQRLTGLRPCRHHRRPGSRPPAARHRPQLSRPSVARQRPHLSCRLVA